MKKYSMIGLIILVISSQGIITTTAFSKSNQGIYTKSLPGLSITNYIDNPVFEHEPSVIINGTSDEFSSDYHESINASDLNYEELTWTHESNTSLDFRSEIIDNYPDCYDFIFLYQEFDWNSNQVPLDAKGYFNYSTFRIGDFESEVQNLNNLMFRVFVWAIDSSGNWIELYESREAIYTENYTQKGFSVNYFTRLAIFGGMIEEDGIQEDPTDTVTIAVGLAPTDRFRYDPFLHNEPWTFYDGSVSIRVSSLELYVYEKEEPDSTHILEPVYENVWRFSVKDVYQDISTEYENASRLEFRDIAVDTDGSVYVLCNCFSDHELSVNQSKSFTYQFVVKYNSKLEQIWSAQNDNRTVAYRIACWNGYVFTTGYIQTDDETESKDLIVTKWSQGGERLWQTQWGETYDEEGADISISSDGSVYVWAVYWNLRFEPQFWKSSFIKIDSSGSLLWNKTIEFPLIPGYSELIALSDGIYSWNGELIEKQDFQQNQIWNITDDVFAVTFDDNGNIFTAVNTGDIPEHWQVTVTKWDSNGQQVWNTNYSVPLDDGNSWYFYSRCIDVVPDGSILVTLHGNSIIYDCHMVKFDSSGNFVWDKIVSDEFWPTSSSSNMKLEIGGNGVAYIGHNYIDDYGVHVGVSAFVIDTNQSLDPLTILILGGIAGTTIVVIAAIIYNQKHK